jgi:hypothetical protein
VDADVLGRRVGRDVGRVAQPRAGQQRTAAALRRAEQVAGEPAWHGPDHVLAREHAGPEADQDLQLVALVRDDNGVEVPHPALLEGAVHRPQVRERGRDPVGPGLGGGLQEDDPEEPHWPLPLGVVDALLERGHPAASNC